MKRADEELAQRVLRATGARSFERARRLTDLWGGYGALWRGELSTESGVSSVIVKDVRPPRDDRSVAHRRKLRSYRVEQSFYARFAKHLGDRSRVAKALALWNKDGAFLTVLEDLEQAGFAKQPRFTPAALAASYAGGGVGVKDVAYLLNCCLSPDECRSALPRWLDRYFATLKAELAPKLEPDDLSALEREWRALFPVAWVDFYRFLQGWAPRKLRSGAVQRGARRAGVGPFVRVMMERCGPVCVEVRSTPTDLSAVLTAL